MSNKNSLCPYSCFLPTNPCYYCHSQQISSLISFEEILPWIVICSGIFFLYNTIKLCIIIFLILSMIYWIYKQRKVFDVFKEFYRLQFSIDGQNDNHDHSSKVSTISTQDLSKADNCDGIITQTIEKLNEKKSSHSSITKKLFIEEFSTDNNLISQPGYYGPIYTIMTDTKIIDDSRTLTDIFEQTKGIRQMIESLQEDILQLKPNLHKATIDNLSIDEQTILRLATENLIKTIISNRIDKSSNLSSEKFIDKDYFLEPFEKYSSKESLESQELNEKQESSSSTFNQQSRKPDDIQSSISEVTSYEITELQHPKCVPVQISFAINSPMPRVPTKATVLSINDDDRENDYEKTIITNEQFENIRTKEERKSESTPFLKQDSNIYNNNEPPDWAYYSSKPDFFPNSLRSDLPIVHSEDQHSSFKQTFLSHFHRRPKFTSTNLPATLHSTSLNATNNIISISSDDHDLNPQNNYIQCSLTIEQQRIAQKLLTNKASFHYIWNKTVSHLKQRIFRVRKSRIIISFDDIQQEKDVDKNNLNTLVNNVVHDISTEINQVRSQLIVNNEEQTKITNSSIVSLFQSFDSAIRDGELLMNNEKSSYQNRNENEDSLSEISNSLYSVTSQLILI